MRVLYWCGAGIGYALLLGSFAGALHPLGDALAVFRTPMAVVGLAWLGLGWAWGLASPLWLLPVLASLLPAALAYLPGEATPPAGITIYQKNMSFRMADTNALEADIRAVAPDVLTLQEVTPANARMLARLADILPHSHICNFEAVGAVALASRWPMRPGQNRCAYGLAMMQVESPSGPLWLASMHLHWPYPYRQSAQHAQLLPELAALDGPVILGGDFNMVRESAVMRRTIHATGSHPGGRPRASFTLEGLLPIGIDHILIPAGQHGQSDLRPLLGSDHRGLVLRY